MAGVSKKLLTEAIFTGGTLSNNNLSMDDLPNPDRMIQKLGENQYDIYEDMLNDDHIYAVAEIMTAGVMRHKWAIYSNDKDHKAQLERDLSDVRIRKVVEAMVSGRLKGMQIFEVVWKLDENGYSFQDIQPLSTKEFVITKEGFIKHKETEKVFNPEKYPYKFLIYKNKGYENPYGVADLMKCYYPWQFKKGGWRFWMTVTEKYGVPTLIVELADEAVAGLDQNQIDGKTVAVAKQFYNIDSDTVICTSGLKEKGITMIEAKAKSQEFKTMIDSAEAAMSKVIIGTHIIMDGGGGGSRALAEIGANINFRFKVQSILKDIEEVVNTAIKWYEFLQTGNPIDENNSRFSIPYINIQDWEKILAAVREGIPVSKKAIYEHVPEPDGDDDVFVKTVAAPDPLHPNQPDEKKPIKETQTETKKPGKGKNDPKKDETRVETSVPGKQDSGQNQ